MKKDLFFREDGTFKILQFTDIHYSDDNEEDHRTSALMKKILQEEKPDFVIATGDTVYGLDNAKNLEKALTPIIEAGIPWSYTFGNHDTENGADYDTLFSILKGKPNCYMYHDHSSVRGMGNHYLEVKNKRGETKWVLLCLDSGSANHIQEVKGYDYIKREQIDWYQNVICNLEKENTSFSVLAFMHIPLPEYHEVWNTQTCYGEKREDVCSPSINSGCFTAMLEAGHTKGVFAGHDHINDYIGTLYGITLAYGRATGYNTYGQDDFCRGARIIQINENNTESFKTYIRLEDGSVIKNQEEHKPEHSRNMH